MERYNFLKVETKWREKESVNSVKREDSNKK